MKKTLNELAQKIQAKVRGDGDCEITGIATLLLADAGDLTFLTNPKYRRYLNETSASAVILTETDAADFAGNALIVADPHYAYAQLLPEFFEAPKIKPGIHASAIIGDHCQIDSTAQIDAHVVLGDGVSIGANTHIYSGTVIGDGSTIGSNGCLYANVTLYDHITIGDRAIIHSGVVIGSDGFGFAHHQGAWHKVLQVGHVVIGDDVEIGANTTIDCGAIGDTIIGNGVKIDNQLQIAHNVQIGDHSILAGCTVIAGSVKIGKHCMIGGATIISGHIEIVDGVILTGGSELSNSVKEPGVYSSGTGLMPTKIWRKNVARFRHLDELARRVKALELNQQRENNHE